MTRKLFPLTDSPNVEVIVKLRLPIGHYEVGAELAQIHDYKYFDDYVSDLIKKDIERQDFLKVGQRNELQ